MKKNILRIVSLLMCMSITLLSISFAADSTAITAATATTTTNTTMSFSLTEAVAYAKTNNYQMLLSVIKQRANKENLSNAKDAQDDAEISYKNSSADSNDNFNSYKTRSGYDVLSAKNDAALLVLQTAEEEAQIQVTVETAYYNLLESKKSYEITKETNAKIKTQVTLAETKKKLGNISELDYQKVVLQSAQFDVSLMNAELNYKKAKMSFNQALGLSLYQEVNLTDNVEYFTYTSPTFDEKLAEIKKSSSTYVGYALDDELFTKLKGLTKAYYGSSSDEYKNILNTEKQNYINFNHYKDTMEYDVIVDISNLNIATKTMENDLKSMVISKLTLQLAQAKFKAGLISQLDLISTELDYQDAELAYIKALHSYKVQVLSFEKNV